MDPVSDVCESWSAVYHQQLFQAAVLVDNPEDPLESLEPTNKEEENEHANRGPTSSAAASSNASTEVQAIDAHQPRVNNGRPEELIPELVEKAVSQSLETHKNEWRESFLSEVTRMMDAKLQAESQAQKLAALEEEVKRLTQENADLKKPKVKTEVPECKLEETTSARAPAPQADIIELTSSDSESEPPTSSSRSSRRKRRLPVAHGSPLPATRANVFPPEPVEGVEATERRFTRGDLCKKIGGSIQTLLVKITNSHGPVGKALGINGYLCPNIHQNPWCPKAPGEHGYMFVGLGDRDRDTFLKEEKQHVFVGQKKKGSQKLSMRYVGHYACKRVDPLTLQEWNSLGPDFHDEYAKLTKEKNKDSRTVNEVKADYDKEILRVPCVQLTCLKYESRLLEGLVSEETSISTPYSSVSVGPTPNGMEGPSPESRSPNAKRPRRKTMKALSQCGDRIYPETPSDFMESGDEGDAEWSTGPNGTKRRRCS
ncbi:hypothetical protein AAF712_001007 [Marasmius tenuissimus]|uniref:DUF6697 domain-containing protein n=1 Tax=Marasmius tenuissimus TaxID=585030 RepID=A0ABR3AGI7_9AGAR